MFYYAGHILVSYQLHTDVDLFKVNGPLLDRIELDKFFRSSKMRAMQIDFITVPRLDWQDREFDTIQRANKQLPKKLIFAGAWLPVVHELAQSDVATQLQFYKQTN